MRVLALSVLLLLGSICSSAVQGQSTPLEDKQKSVLLFDIRMDLITGSDLGKSLGLSEKMAGMQAGPGSPDPAKMKRVFGAMSAPENMQEAQSMSQGAMPVEFFVRMQFTDESSASEFAEGLKKESSGTVEKNGKTYYKPPADGNAPDNIMMHMVDATTVEMGTDIYVTRDTKAGPPFSDGLKAAWGNVPKNQAIRLAVDLEGAENFVAEAIAMGKQQVKEPTMGEFMNLIDNVKNLRLSIDIQGDNLLTLQATGKGGSETTDFKDGLDALLFMGKTAGKPGVAQMEQMDPKGARVASEILKALKAKQDGDEISVVIPKPNGFNAVVENAVNNIVPMMMGGMGGPGGPPGRGGGPGGPPGGPRGF
jgi:hypothetical protein